MKSQFYIKALSLALIVVTLILSNAALGNAVKIKDLTRLSGVKDNALVGYGIITGLAGTGDSSRSKSTFQSIKNILLT